MKVFGVILLAGVMACCGCTSRAKVTPRSNDSGVVKAERAEGSGRVSEDSVWQPMVPQSDFDKERAIYRDYQKGLSIQTARRD